MSDLSVFLEQIANSTIVCSTDNMNCSDVMSGSDRNVAFSTNGRSWRGSNGGFVGISIATFSSGGNNAPVKPFTGIKAYQAINGLTTISGN